MAFIGRSPAPESSGSTIADGSITAADLANNAITTDKIADGAISTDKLDSTLSTDIDSKATTGKAIAMSIVFGG